MRKTLRLALAAVTGAAVITSGAAITALTPASASAMFGAAATGTDFTDKFIPPSGSDKIPFKVAVTGAYADGKPGKVSIQYLKPEEAESSAHAGTAADIPAQTSSPSPGPSDVSVAASIPVASNDKPGDWKYRIGWTAGNAATGATPDWGAWTTLAVAKATRVISANVDPDTVKLKSGTEIDVYAAFKLERGGAADEEKVTDVRLESKDSDDYYSLNTGLESDDSYHDSTSMDYDTETGSWQLKVTVTRGSKSYAFVKGFQVTKGAGKAKSKITLVASPSKVKKGKSVKLYGKVYRGYTSWGAWKKKILRLYFKKKGTSTWKFVGYVGANSSGKYSKTVKPKYDGYWRLGATASSVTNKAWSPSKFVDVR
ncbi:hypothetical protein Aph01nite_75830 [Acrocarpospora phusangensis]|uniref:Calcium-binding protein n=1 Tax=Acrocarpospora phusangensis TaxID=1070424 RepID=A0A919QI87_9ACTN|nr:hypothetical protein [Acrocarpospora phusangensis]GIH29273.1 hypothetical protein Aph01nite_75830 [Acrocarpospora phusangensis]